jgi:hypothetical protein
VSTLFQQTVNSRVEHRLVQGISVRKLNRMNDTRIRLSLDDSLRALFSAARRHTSEDSGVRRAASQEMLRVDDQLNKQLLALLA